MTEPIPSPDPGTGPPPGGPWPDVPPGVPPGGPQPPGVPPGRPGDAAPGDAAAPPAGWRLAAVVAAVVAGSALLGVAAGFIWAAVAPRALLAMAGRGEAEIVHPETAAFIAADGWFALIMIVGGVISGLLGYLLAVRRYGPLAMAGVLAGALGAAFLSRWIGEQSGLATFHHLMATLPAGAHLNDALTLRASGALALWPLAAGLVAGGIAALASPARPRGTSEHRPPQGPDGPGLAGAPPGAPGAA